MLALACWHVGMLGTPVLFLDKIQNFSRSEAHGIPTEYHMLL